MFNVSKKTIISGAIGNALEMYDYVIWGLFSVYLAKEFLPPQSKLSDIFFLFLITYILRPIGSVIGGILSDQIGRKKVLTLSIFVMGVCTTVVGILPSYEQIGVVSVLLLLFIRLIQVCSVGSEYISSISLLIESCDKDKRGYFGSWAAFGVNAGVLISSLVGALVLYLIDIHCLPSWGWRLAFILSSITMLVGFWIRSSIPESFEFITENARKERRTFKDILNETLSVIKIQLFESLLVFFLVLFGVSTTILLFIYAPIHMITINTIHNTQSFIINSCSLALLVILVPFFGHISDVNGRAKTLGTGIISLLMLVVPYFSILSSGTFLQVILFHTLIAIPCACIFAVTPVFITEIFPLSIRCSITNLIYSLAACLGGGVTPLIALTLGHNSQTGYGPSFILVILGVISLGLLGMMMRRCRSGITQPMLVSESASNLCQK
ncbi:MAG: MFS transporter [Legionellales bacterium]|nr:MFS transporter [Legionellales bacterium]